MCIEERLEALEHENRQLKDDVEQLKRLRNDQFVTVAELAEIMKCTRSTVHRMIKEGKIFASRKTGDPRIPLSQFYGEEPEKLVERKYVTERKEPKRELSMQEQIFGRRIG